MDKGTIIQLTEDYVRSCMENKEPGHDFLHVQRVRKTALKLAKTVQSDHFLVEMCSLLHDIEDHKFSVQYKVADFFETLPLEKEYKEKILIILPNLSFSKCPHLPESFPIEGKIVQDADRLDAIGAIGVARAFSYGGSKGRKMYGTPDSTINHFDEKLLVLDRYLYLDESKRIAEKRIAYLKGFYDEFLLEVSE